MTVRTVCDNDLPAFKKLFCEYYTELDCEDDPLPLFDGRVAPDLADGLLSAAIAIDGDGLCAFVIFQIDDVINDWCFAEGKGDVREIFVAQNKRRKGLGRKLLAFAEGELKRAGAAEIYLLPTDETEGFFTACGYADFGEYCAEIDSKVFSKSL